MTITNNIGSFYLSSQLRSTSAQSHKFRVGINKNQCIKQTQDKQECE